jgi:peroxiredoxin
MTSPLRYNFNVITNQPAPDFELPDLQGTLHKLSDYRGRIVIVNFWSAECPHSERTDQSIAARLAAEWAGEVELISIAANRDESTHRVGEVSKTRGIPNVLIDADQVVADRYAAMATPHVFVVDRDGILRYRGAVDNVTIRQREARRFFLMEAVDALLENRLPELTETPAYGCALVREI